MKNSNAVMTAAVASLLTLAAIGAQTSAVAADKMDMEKCYGVAKAGKNDCKTLSNACAGHSSSDGQKDAFIAVPTGTCERIVGGQTQMPGM